MLFGLKVQTGSICRGPQIAVRRRGRNAGTRCSQLQYLRAAVS